MKKRKFPMRWMSIVLLLALLSTSCQWLTGTKEPVPLTPVPTLTQPPQASPTPAIPYPPPRLLYRAPETGEAQALDAPIELVFDQPMDADSVAEAFAIEPSVNGELEWADSRTLVFKPAEPLARDASYRVTVGATARNAEGTALADPVAFQFQTVGHLVVSEVQPAPDSADVAPDTSVTVVFNRPVVPLTAIGNQAALPNPLTFTPPVQGTGEWLNTSIYRFHPEGGFLPATVYTVRVAGLSDTSGSPLAEDYTWTFTTQRPLLLRWTPGTEEQHIGPNAVISMTFNQPMDHASVEAAFMLSINDQPIAGTFRWSGGQTIIAEESMTFIPAAPLPRNVRPYAVLSNTAHARHSDVTLPQQYAWRFYTVNDPGVISTSPTNGETNVSPYSDIVIDFASPMQRDGFMDYVRIIPQPTSVYTYWSEADTEVRISLSLEPATVYNVTLDGAAPDKYGMPLGETLRLRFTTGDLSPYATLNTIGDLSTFSTYTDTAIYAGYRNVSRLDAELYRLSVEDFTRFYDYRNYDFRNNFHPPAADLVRRWSVSVDPPRNTARLIRLDMVDAGGDQLPPGIYFLQLTAPEVWQYDSYARPAQHVFIRSHINLTMKQTRTEALVWATDLATGEPVPNLPIRFKGQDLDWHSEGQTDSDGVYLSAARDETELWDSYFAFSGQPGDADFAVAFNAWDSGIRPWDFDVSADYGSGHYAGYLYTDRPIYRPGQTVYFKGIVRADDDANYTIPADLRELTVRVDDPQGKELYNERLTLSDMGTLFGELTLDEAAPLGTYYIQMQEPDLGFYTGASFTLAEYRKPEFQVTVTTDRDAYLNGETIRAVVEASYYFGGAVANARVNWNVLSADYGFNYQCPRGEKCPYYSWTDYDWERERGGYGSYGRLVASGETVTDEQGRVVIDIPADIAEELTSRRFTIEANVTDINDQYVSNRTTTIVHKGEFYIGLAPQGRIAKAGEARGVDILTVDWDSAPVAAGELEVVFMEHRWYNVRQQAEDGNFYWTWAVEDVPIYTTTVTTGADGKAVATFTPPSSGSYKIRATGKDARGNVIRSSTYVWVWGGRAAYWRQESNNRIDLITDKDTYAVGDVAEILIPSPYSGTVNALVTIERGHILETAVIELYSNSEVLRIPITAAHIPNIFVSVVIVQGSAQSPDALASFKMGTVLLPVSTEEKELTITLTPDRSIESGEYYRPRETAIYDVLVTDHAGKPVVAELSLRLADLAVLALADETGPTLLERFWSRRGLGVRTSAALAVAMEAYNRELAPAAKGGGGGGDGDNFIRTNFADTAFWDPVVRTGTDGRARVAVKLPDNLTTWRMQARGITAETLVGRTDVDVLSTLDLLVRPVLPRFFVVGDRAEIATIVHNNTGAAVSAVVTLTVEGLEVAGATQQTVNIPAGDKVKVVWPVTALPEEKVTVRMEAWGDGYYDGREDTLPVYRYSTPEVVGTAGRLAGPELRQEIVQLPRVFDPTQGELTVQLDGSLTAATADALTYLEHFPYECVEQTVSRFLPNVLTYQALEEMGIARPGLKAALTEQVGVALQRLYAQQKYDGGWGWWQTDISNPYLTAYVLQGMLEAHRTGFTVDKAVMHKAAGFLRTNLVSADQAMPHWQANRLAYQLYVLGEYINLVSGAEPAGELARAIKLFEVRHLLDHYGRATLAVALGLLEPAEDTRIKTLLSDLNGAAIYSATGTHWEEAQPDYWNMNTDIRTTATVLWAMARHNPESDLLPNIVRWLMNVRKEGYWGTTQSTSWSLMALVAYMRATGELRGDFSYTVTLNGEVLLQGDIDVTTLDESQKLTVSIAELLVEEGNRLIIERLPASGGQTGEGQLYYTAHLRYFLPVDQVKALDRGIIIARQYSLVEDPQVSVDSAQVGDVIRVKLTVVAPTDLYYVVVEDPLPAGCEAVDVTLNTTSVVGERPGVRNLTAEEEDAWYRWYGWGWWWFSHSEMRDEKIALFATYLPRGTYEYSYIMRASVPGTYNVIPATASQMYFPEVFGRSDGGRFTVEE
ncbi:MAG: Ig-like domain-containing protein [Anaerolineae bacterium]